MSLPREKNIHTCLIISKTIEYRALITKIVQQAIVSVLPVFASFKGCQKKGIFAISGDKDKFIRKHQGERERERERERTRFIIYF